MAEEIKEILNNLIINETTGMCYLSIRLTNQTRNIITNLQQENERLKEINNINNDEEFIYSYEELQDKVINLQHIEEQHKKLNGELRKENKKLQSRNEKAINSIDILQEIIYQQPTDNKADDMWLLDKLDGFKNILNGENND